MFAEIAAGATVTKVCKSRGIPVQFFWQWRAEPPLGVEGFAAGYSAAFKQRLETWAEHVNDISDDGSNDTYEKRDEDGNVIGEGVNVDVLGRSKLRVQTKQWLLSRLQPEKYGDRTAIDLNAKHEHSVSPELLQKLKEAME